MVIKIEHVAIIVQDMDKSINYYEEMFGFKVRTRGQNTRRDMAFIYHPDQPGMEIELIKDLIPLGEYDRQGIVNHLAFTVEDIEKAIKYYREKGIVFLAETPNITFSGAKTIFFYGPSNELLQLVEPAPLT